MSNKFYVYFWVDPIAGIPFYVGKGCNDRKFKLHKTQRCYYKLKSFLDKGYSKADIVKVVNENLTEDDALKLEEQYISQYKRIEEGGTLFNYELGKSQRSGSKNKIIDPLIINDILNHYSNGLTAYQIGVKFNCHETTILRYLRQYNMNVRSSGYRFIPKSEYCKIADLYVTNSTPKIAKIYGCTVPTIVLILRSLNIKIRGKKTTTCGLD